MWPFSSLERLRKEVDVLISGHNSLNDRIGIVESAFDHLDIPCSGCGAIIMKVAFNKGTDGKYRCNRCIGGGDEQELSRVSEAGA